MRMSVVTGRKELSPWKMVRKEEHRGQTWLCTLSTPLRKERAKAIQRSKSWTL